MGCGHRRRSGRRRRSVPSAGPGGGGARGTGLRFDGEAGTVDVWLFVGVNGVGKTTTVGKVARRQAAAGRSVLLAAGDTFRAAAGEQLAMWAERAGTEIVRGAEGGDPSAVVFDAVQRAAARGNDLVLADTAGRLHTKVNLVEELKKIRRVADRAPGRVTEVLLVLDATTGQNGLVQAKQFTDAVAVTGVVLTKLDGTAKGGVVVAVQRELGLPVKLVGLGEGADDLVPFEPERVRRRPAGLTALPGPAEPPRPGPWAGPGPGSLSTPCSTPCPTAWSASPVACGAGAGCPTPTSTRRWARSAPPCLRPTSSSAWSAGFVAARPRPLQWRGALQQPHPRPAGHQGGPRGAGPDPRRRDPQAHLRLAPAHRGAAGRPAGIGQDDHRGQAGPVVEAAGPEPAAGGRRPAASGGRGAAPGARRPGRRHGVQRAHRPGGRGRGRVEPRPGARAGTSASSTPPVGWPSTRS